jgi:hypothetical protein
MAHRACRWPRGRALPRKSGRSAARLHRRLAAPSAPAAPRTGRTKGGGGSTSRNVLQRFHAGREYSRQAAREVRLHRDAGPDRFAAGEFDHLADRLVDVQAILPRRRLLAEGICSTTSPARWLVPTIRPSACLASSRFGGGAPSQRKSAAALVAVVAIGCLISWVIDTDSCPIVATRFACARPSAPRGNAPRSRALRLPPACARSDRARIRPLVSRSRIDTGRVGCRDQFSNLDTRRRRLKVCPRVSDPNRQAAGSPVWWQTWYGDACGRLYSRPKPSAMSSFHIAILGDSFFNNVERFSLGGAAHRLLRWGYAAGIRAGERKTCCAKALPPPPGLWALNAP